MRVYLDVCCLGRVFEESDQPRVQAERAAIEDILAGDHEIISSAAISYEIARDPNQERRDSQMILNDDIRDEVIALNPAINARAADLSAIGFGTLDALHIACAEAGRCEWLLTTDDRLQKRAARADVSLKVKVDNPATWVLRFPTR